MPDDGFMKMVTYIGLWFSTNLFILLIYKVVHIIIPSTDPKVLTMKIEKILKGLFLGNISSFFLTFLMLGLIFFDKNIINSVKIYYN